MPHRLQIYLLQIGKQAIPRPLECSLGFWSQYFFYYFFFFKQAKWFGIGDQVLPDIVGSAVCQKFFVAAFLQAEVNCSWASFYNKELDHFHMLYPR